MLESTRVEWLCIDFFFSWQCKVPHLSKSMKIILFYFKILNVLCISFWYSIVVAWQCKVSYFCFVGVSMWHLDLDIWFCTINFKWVLWPVVLLVAVSEGDLFSQGRLPQDYPMKIVWKKGFIRLVLVVGILWMMLILIALLFHVWSCQSSVSFFSGISGRYKIFPWIFNLLL